MEITIRRRAQFHETDAAGIVHFSRFFLYMEEAEQALWRMAGMSNAPTRDMGWPRVAAAFEYHSPLRYEDEFDVTLRIETMSQRTIRYVCAVTRGTTPIATGRQTVVCVRRRDGEPFAAVEIPVEIVDGLKRLRLSQQAGGTR